MKIADPKAKTMVPLRSRTVTPEIMIMFLTDIYKKLTILLFSSEKE